MVRPEAEVRGRKSWLLQAVTRTISRKGAKTPRNNEESHPRGTRRREETTTYDTDSSEGRNRERSTQAPPRRIPGSFGLLSVLPVSSVVVSPSWCPFVSFVDVSLLGDFA